MVFPFPLKNRLITVRLTMAFILSLAFGLNSINAQDNSKEYSIEFINRSEQIMQMNFANTEKYLDELGFTILRKQAGEDGSKICMYKTDNHLNFFIYYKKSGFGLRPNMIWQSFTSSNNQMQQILKHFDKIPNYSRVEQRKPRVYKTDWKTKDENKVVVFCLGDSQIDKGKTLEMLVALEPKSKAYFDYSDKFTFIGPGFRY